MSLTRDGIILAAQRLYIEDELTNPHELRVSLFNGGQADIRTLPIETLLNTQVIENFLRVQVDATMQVFDGLNALYTIDFQTQGITALEANYFFDRAGIWRNTNEVGIWTGDFVSSTYNLTGPFLSGTTTLYTNNLQVNDPVYINDGSSWIKYFVRTSSATDMTFSATEGGAQASFTDATDVKVIDGVGDLIQINILTGQTVIFQNNTKAFTFQSIGQSV